MVLYCEGCQVSHKEGTPCDCGCYAVCNGDIGLEGAIAFRYAAAGPRDALMKFLGDRRWDGESPVDVLALFFGGPPHQQVSRSGYTYYLDEAEWIDGESGPRPRCPYPQGYFEVVGNLDLTTYGHRGLSIL